MGYKVFAFIFLLSILSTCSSDSLSPKQIEKISIQDALMQEQIDIKLSEVGESIRYIKLESTMDCIIDEVEKLVIKDSFIYISNEQQFFQFDLNGKFIRQFGAKGKGPGEYVYISDFSINSLDNIVSIYDIDLRKINHYTTDGDLIREDILSSMPSLLAYDKELNLKLTWTSPDFSLNDQYGINTYNSNGELVNRFFDRSDEGISISDAYSMPSTSSSRFQVFNDSLTFWEINYPYICRVIDNEIYPRFLIDLGYAPAKGEMNDNQIEQEKFIYSDLVETSRFIFLTKGLYKNQVKHILYDKKTQSVKSFRVSYKSPGFQINSGFVNDIDNGYPILPDGVVSKDEIYCTFFAHDFLKIRDESPFKEITSTNTQAQDKLENILQNSSLEDNPIVMIVKTKKL